MYTKPVPSMSNPVFSYSSFADHQYFKEIQKNLAANLMLEWITAISI